MIAKHFTETSNKVELRINRVRINRSRPVLETMQQIGSDAAFAFAFALI